MLIDDLGNIVIAGYTDNDDNFIASFTESGTINFSMVYDNNTYGSDIIDLMSTSDYGIVAVSESNNFGCIQVT
jgi:hypothetical protein